MRSKQIVLTQAIVQELLHYDPVTGELTWRRRDREWFVSDGSWRSWNTKFADRPAFVTLDRDGYLRGSIRDRTYISHRIIWLWMTGRFPDPEVDHDNGDRTDNRWDNLSETTITNRKDQHHDQQTQENYAA